jgi:hypothetical protein
MGWLECVATCNLAEACGARGLEEIMKRVGIQELCERASELLTGNEVLTVERQGQAVGVYLPLSSSPDHNARDSLAALRTAVAAALANGQMTEDELADLFDLRSATG